MSLVELMVSMAIFSVFSIAAFQFLMIFERVWGTSQNRMAIQNDLRGTVEEISQEFRQSSPTSPLGIQVTNGGRTVTFQVPFRVVNGTITQWSNVQFIYTPATREIWRWEQQGGAGPWTNRLLGNDLQNVAYTYNPAADPRNLLINMTATRNTLKGETVRVNLATQATTRNP